jgi:hypothetical protein
VSVTGVLQGHGGATPPSVPASASAAPDAGAKASAQKAADLAWQHPADTKADIRSNLS